MEKRTEILDAATRLFSERGYHLALSELASAVGIRTPSLYSHFSGKYEILETMLVREIDAYFAVYRARLDDLEASDCRGRFEGLFLSTIDWFRTRGRLRLWRNMTLIPQAALRDGCRMRIAEGEAECGRTVLRWFREGVESCSLRASADEGAVHLYFAMTQGLLDMLLLYLSDPDAVTARAAQVFEAFWRGVGKEAGDVEGGNGP